MAPDGSMAEQSEDEPVIRDEFHGFYDAYGNETIEQMNECTLFITDEELVIGDQGEYQVLGGIPKMLPSPADSIVRKFFADDSAETIRYNVASKQHDTTRVSLTDISEIEVEKGMSPSSKQMVEVEQKYGEISIFIGTAKSYGGEEDTRAFVEALATAAEAAGGAPRVTNEFEF